MPKTPEQKREAMRRWRKKNAAHCRAYKVKYENEHRAKTLEYKKKYHQSINKPRVRLHRYGLSAIEFDQMFDRQKGKCAICLRVFTTDRVLPPMIDHSHKTGKVRGLLCNRCNWALVVFETSEGKSMVKRAVKYLGFSLKPKA